MIIIALGANLPGRYETPLHALEGAYEALENNGIHILQKSRFYLTRPVPVSDQPWYHNAVVRVQTKLSPYGLLETLQNIEHEFGRVRSTLNAPRVLDLDLIAYDEVILNKPELIVPHPRAHLRKFVLAPLYDVAPDWQHPISEKSVQTLLNELPTDQDIEVLA